MRHAIFGFLIPAAIGAQTTRQDATRDTATRDTSARALPTMQVTASAVAIDARRIAQPTAQLSAAALRRSQGASLGETLEALPGVRSLSMTTGIGKPVIRGLTNNRVVTLANGQRTETQQWGHDHSPNVESADAERIEVVKGPASVLYGSDALGGVVNVVRRPLPSAEPGTSLLRGRVAMAYHGANNAPSTTLTAEGARGVVGWRFTGTGRTASNLRTPAGQLANSGNSTGYLEGAIGTKAAQHSIGFVTSLRDETIQIADDPITAPGYDGRQRIRTYRSTLDGEWQRGAQRFQIQAGYEGNRRAEYATAATPDVTLGLQSHNANGFVHWHHAPWRGVTGTVGLALQRTQFTTFGQATLIPDNSTMTTGLYAIQQRVVGSWALSSGARYDWRTLETPGNRVLGLAATSRRYDAFTGTLGAVYRHDKPVSVAMNVARGFRAPSASDLFANGFHEGTRAFEIGRSDLRVESSLNADLGVRLATSRLRGEWNVYHNRIADYIYLAPIGVPGRALDSLEVRQGNARLMGSELGMQWRLSPTFSFSNTTDYTHASNTTDGSALPFVPPFRTQQTLRWEQRAPGRSLSVTSEWHAKQTRRFRADMAPPSWHAVHVAAGVSRLTSRGLVHLDVSVRNALDARYRDFMSRYKEFADAAGRAVVVRVSADW
ncbi:MAG: TonB-dependent receptor [Gemmatimonadaceae bacterium]|nr:TonB-dependent receptor [Gemmatimonadaceae bacterium]